MASRVWSKCGFRGQVDHTSAPKITLSDVKLCPAHRSLIAGCTRSGFSGLGGIRRPSRYTQPLKLNAVGGDLREVVVGLLGDPALGASAEDLGEADGHLRGDAAFAIDEF